MRQVQLARVLAVFAAVMIVAVLSVTRADNPATPAAGSPDTETAKPQVAEVQIVDAESLTEDVELEFVVEGETSDDNAETDDDVIEDHHKHCPFSGTPLAAKCCEQSACAAKCCQKTGCCKGSSLEVEFTLPKELAAIQKALGINLFADTCFEDKPRTCLACPDVACATNNCKNCKCAVQHQAGCATAADIPGVAVASDGHATPCSPFGPVCGVLPAVAGQFFVPPPQPAGLFWEYGPSAKWLPDAPQPNAEEARQALKQAARQLDDVANNLEDAKLFGDADALRAFSQQLRIHGRQLPSTKQDGTAHIQPKGYTIGEPMSYR